MKKTKKKKIKKSVLFKGISLIVMAFSLIVFIFLIRLQMIPFKYLILIFILLLLLDSFLYLLMSCKNYRLRILGTLLSILLVFSFSFILYYQSVTESFLKNISFLNIQTETYYVLVLKESNYESLDDLSSKEVDYLESKKGAQKAFQTLSKKVTLKDRPITDTTSLIERLKKGYTEAILMEKEEFNLYKEMDSSLSDEVRIIETLEVNYEKENIAKEVEITKEPFSVYITGIDTYGKLSSVSRSDVNMVVTVNPKTHQVLLTSIPRDYYVSVYGSENDLKDKLTHTGLKGVETTVKTIENLLETDINYYVRLNFTSLIKIVDAIGGITVDNPFLFTADYEEEDEHIYYVFKKGEIDLNGKQALAYVRERYNLREGDVARARHQQQVIKGIVNKVTSPTILIKYPEIIGSIEGNFTTNMSLDSIKNFFEWQLDNMPSWEIKTNVLSGVDDYQKTLSMPDLYSYVMMPSSSSISEAIKEIDEITGSN